MSDEIIFDWRACIKRAKLARLIKEAEGTPAGTDFFGLDGFNWNGGEPPEYAVNWPMSVTYVMRRSQRFFVLETK